VEMAEAENPATANARAPFQQIYASSALVAVGREIRITKKTELSHRSRAGFETVARCAELRTSRGRDAYPRPKDDGSLVRRAAIASFRSR